MSARTAGIYRNVEITSLSPFLYFSRHWDRPLKDFRQVHLKMRQPLYRGPLRLLHICESELIYLDMTINAKKSCCIRNGPRNRAACAPICCSSGVSLPWVEELRYLGIFITRSRVFKISLDHAKKVFIVQLMPFLEKSVE